VKVMHIAQRGTSAGRAALVRARFRWHKLPYPLG